RTAPAPRWKPAISGACSHRSHAKTRASFGTLKTASSSAFSQTMESFGARASTSLRTATCLLCGEKPKASAASESPSSTMNAPCSTRKTTCFAGSADPAAITVTLPAGRLIEDRIRCHGLTALSGPTVAAHRSAGISKTKNNLASDRIPEPGAEVEIIRTAWVTLINRINAAQQIHRKQQRFRHPIKVKPEARAAFNKIGPILALAIDREIPVQVNLRLEAVERLRLRERIAGTILRIEQQVAIEAVNVNSIVGRVGEKSRFASDLAAHPAKQRHPAAIVRNRQARPRMAAEIAERLARFAPSGDAMPRIGAHPQPENEAALRKILRLAVAKGRRRRSARVANEARRNVRANRQTPELRFRLDLAVCEKILPARRVERINPSRGREALKLRPQIIVCVAGFGRDGGIGALARQTEPLVRVLIVMQQIVGPGEFQHHVEIERVRFVCNFEILQSVLEIPGAITLLRHRLCLR